MEMWGNIAPCRPDQIAKMYPEFDLRGAFTTSLEPYVPLWALVPFFEKLIVGIVPYIATEEAFRNWYGVSIKQLLDLYERGRVQIRVLFPSAANTVPKLLNPFFSGNFPSTARDLAFDAHLLGEAQYQELRTKFANVVSRQCGERSIDGMIGHRGRAFKTAQTAFVQLHALNYEWHAKQFEEMWKTDQEGAFRWLEVCRLFLIGPVHYSLLGIHCVASAVPESLRRSEGTTIHFPSELGRILVNAVRLVRFQEKQGEFTLDHCISVFPDFELARRALLELDAAIKRGDEKRTIGNAEDLRKLITEARSKRMRWLQRIKLVASTGVGVLTLPLSPLVGLLASLGFDVASDAIEEKVDSALTSVVGGLQPESQRHLNLLINLDDAARRHFKDKG